MAETKPANRPSAAVALRLGGATYGQVADILGYETPAIAQKEVERALAGVLNTADADIMRQMMDARMERLLQSCWPKALDSSRADHIAYVRTVLAILERQARLHGLDAPTEHVVYTPTTEQIQQLADSMRGHPKVIEADVLMERAEAQVMDE
jgi:hypothetical protein